MTTLERLHAEDSGLATERGARCAARGRNSLDQALPVLNLTSPDLVRAIHVGYVEAGVDIVQTNTFGGFPGCAWPSTAWARSAPRSTGSRSGSPVTQPGSSTGRCWSPARSPPRSTGSSATRSVRPNGPTRLRHQIETMSRPGSTWSCWRHSATSTNWSRRFAVAETFFGTGDRAGRPSAPMRARCAATRRSRSSTPSPDGHRRSRHQLRARPPADAAGAPRATPSDRSAAHGPAQTSVCPGASRRPGSSTTPTSSTSPATPVNWSSRARNIVGGCCAPHRPTLAAVVETVERHRHAPARSARPRRSSHRSQGPRPPRTRPAESRLTVTVQVVAPEADGLDELVRTVGEVVPLGIDGVSVTPVVLLRAAPSQQCRRALHLHQRLGLEATAAVSTWTGRAWCLQADLLGAHALGLRRIVCETGSPPLRGEYPPPDGIWDLDSVGLVELLPASTTASTTTAGGATRTEFEIGAWINPGAHDVAHELARVEEKLTTGVHFLVTRPIHEPSGLRRLLGMVRRPGPGAGHHRPADRLRPREYWPTRCRTWPYRRAPWRSFIAPACRRGRSAWTRGEPRRRGRPARRWPGPGPPVDVATSVRTLLAAATG